MSAATATTAQTPGAARRDRQRANRKAGRCIDCAGRPRRGSVYCRRCEQARVDKYFTRLGETPPRVPAD